MILPQYQRRGYGRFLIDFSKYSALSFLSSLIFCYLVKKIFDNYTPLDGVIRHKE